MLRSNRPSARSFAHLLTAVFILFMCAYAQAADLRFPQLDGRVVDNAQLLSPSMESKLTQMLKAEEDANSHQLVIITVLSLHGLPIEDYGYQLGRHWGIGQAERNNGVLLIVAPNERKVRIEVGYGLEGVLPDATAKRIIDEKILPLFRANNMSAGIYQGAESIIAVINGEKLPALVKAPEIDWGFIIILGLFGLVFAHRVYRSYTDPPLPHGDLDSPYYGSGGNYGGSGGGFGGGGGFSGGGGGFGGGGASGGW